MRPGEGRKVAGCSALMRHSMAWPLSDDVLLREGERRARGDADLLVHEVDAGDHLGHGMLDLDAGVHLDEVELAVLVEELDRARADILQLLHGLGHGVADARAHVGIERRGGAFLPHLLVAALQRAVALEQVDRAAAPVAEHLQLDVARLLEVLLEVDGVVAERGLGLGAGGLEGVDEVVLGARHLHAAPAAAGGRLDQHGVADVGGHAHGLVVVGDAAFGAGHAGDAEALGRALGLDLVAHDADVLRLGADEVDVVALQDLGEARVLGEEAVAGMHRVGAGDLAGRQQGGDVEIAVARRRAGRCRRSRRRGAHAWRRRRPWNARRPWRCRAPWRRAARAARSRRGWR